MSVLNWKNVDAPRFGDTSDLLRGAGNTIVESGRLLGNAIGGIQADYQNRNASQLAANMAKYATPADYQAAVASGALMNNVHADALTPEANKSILSRAGDLANQEYYKALAAKAGLDQEKAQTNWDQRNELSKQFTEAIQSGNIPTEMSNLTPANQKYILDALNNRSQLNKDASSIALNNSQIARNLVGTQGDNLDNQIKQNRVAQTNIGTQSLVKTDQENKAQDDINQRTALEDGSGKGLLTNFDYSVTQSQNRNLPENVRAVYAKNAYDIEQHIRNTYGDDIVTDFNNYKNGLRNSSGSSTQYMLNTPKGGQTSYIPKNNDGSPITFGNANTVQAKRLDDMKNNLVKDASTAIGNWQITKETMERNAPKVFGNDWRSTEFTPQNQEKVADSIANNEIIGRNVDPSKVFASLKGTKYASVGSIKNAADWAAAKEIVYSNETPVNAPDLNSMTDNRNSLGSKLDGLSGRFSSDQISKNNMDTSNKIESFKQQNQVLLNNAGLSGQIAMDNIDPNQKKEDIQKQFYDRFGITKQDQNSVSAGRIADAMKLVRGYAENKGLKLSDKALATVAINAMSANDYLIKNKIPVFNGSQNVSPQTVISYNDVDKILTNYKALANTQASNGQTMDQLGELLSKNKQQISNIDSYQKSLNDAAMAVQNAKNARERSFASAKYKKQYNLVAPVLGLKPL